MGCILNLMFKVWKKSWSSSIQGWITWLTNICLQLVLVNLTWIKFPHGMIWNSWLKWKSYMDKKRPWTQDWNWAHGWNWIIWSNIITWMKLTGHGWYEWHGWSWATWMYLTSRLKLSTWMELDHMVEHHYMNEIDLTWVIWMTWMKLGHMDISSNVNKIWHGMDEIWFHGWK